MKKIQSFFLPFLLFALSCNKQVETSQQLRSSSTDAVTIQQMYNDPDYIKLSNLSKQLADQMLPDADLQYLLQEDMMISPKEFSYTVKQLGFRDTTAYRAFQKKQMPLQQRLNKKYA